MWVSTSSLTVLFVISSVSIFEWQCCFSHWKDTVNTIVTDMLEWPHRIVVPIGGIPVDTRYLHFYEYSSDQALHLSVPYLLNPCNVLMGKVDFGLLQFATYILAKKKQKTRLCIYLRNDLLEINSYCCSFPVSMWIQVFQLFRIQIHVRKQRSSGFW